jgi:hypothetical protein
MKDPKYWEDRKHIRGSHCLTVKLTEHDTTEHDRGSVILDPLSSSPPTLSSSPSISARHSFGFPSIAPQALSATSNTSSSSYSTTSTTLPTTPIKKEQPSSAIPRISFFGSGRDNNRQTQAQVTLTSFSLPIDLINK